VDLPLYRSFGHSGCSEVSDKYAKMLAEATATPRRKWHQVVARRGGEAKGEGEKRADNLASANHGGLLFQECAQGRSTAGFAVSRNTP